MLDGLDKINWTKLEHAFGPATDVPGHIQNLVSDQAEVRRQARDALYGNLLHQGYQWPAALATIPFLTELVHAPSTPEREGLLKLLAHLAVGFPDMWLDGGFDPEFVRTQGEMQACCYDAVLWASSTYAELLAPCETAEVRAAAAFLLAFLPASASQHRAAVLARLHKETDPDAKASLLLCLGLWAKSLQRTEEKALFEQALEKSKTRPVRAAAAICLAFLDKTQLPEAAFEALLTAARSVKTRYLPWHGGNLRAYALMMLRGLGPELVAKAVEKLRKAMRAADQDDPTRQEIAEALVALAFEPAPLSPQGRLRRDLPLPGQLSEVQKEVLGCIARRVPQAHWKPEALRAAGLPSSRDELRRYLGLDPAGPMEAKLTGAVDDNFLSWPVWKWCKLVALGTVHEDLLVQGLQRQFKTEEQLSICLTMVEGPYDLLHTGSWELGTAERIGLEVLSRGPEGIRAELRKEAQRMLQEAKTPSSVWLVLSLYARLLAREGKVLHSKYDPLIVAMLEEEQEPMRLELARQVLASLPEKRREKLLLATSLQESIERSSSDQSATEVACAKQGWYFIDMARSQAAAEKVISAIEMWPPFLPKPVERAVEVLVSIGKAAIEPLTHAVSQKKPCPHHDVLVRALKRLRSS